MRTLIPIALFAVLALTACKDAPASQINAPAASTAPTAMIHLVGTENVIVLHKDGASLLVPIDAVIGRAIQVVDGKVTPVTTAADLSSLFIAPCPCCKQGCDEFCMPPLPCDETMRMLEQSQRR